MYAAIITKQKADKMAVFSIIVGVVVAYLILMFFIHKMFEKFFMMLIILLTALFMFGALYFLFK